LSRAAHRALTRVKTGAERAAERAKALLWQVVRGPSEGWMTFVLLLLCVLLAVRAMDSAQWVPTPGLYSAALYGVLLGLILAKLRFGPWRLAIGGLLVGLFVSFYRLTGLAEEASTLDRFAEVGARLVAWWQAFAGGGTSADTLPFTLFLLLTSWLVGFVSAWFLFRKHNTWGAVLPGGIILVASLTTLPAREQLIHLYPYLFMALLLIARMFTLERQHGWRDSGIQHLRDESGIRLPDGLWFALAVLLVTSLLPLQAVRIDPVAAAWQRINYPVRAMSDELARVLVGVQVRKTDSAHYFGDAQPFGGGITLREEPVLIVEAPLALYLRARSYDFYSGDGWSTSDTRLVSADWVPEQGVADEFRKLQAVEVTVRGFVSLAAGEPLYLSGHPVNMSLGYRLDVLEPARYQLSVSEGGLRSSLESGDLPLDLQRSVRLLQELSGASARPLTESEIRSVLPEDMWVVSWSYGSEGVEGVTVERRMAVPLDVVSVRSTDTVAAGSSYRAAVLVPTATAGDLRAAGTDYAGWVLDRYLQLPDALSPRVMELAQELTGGIDNPYEKAVAVRDYLRTLDYSLEIEAPPPGACGVDYFLFQLDKGYCQYFASAMTVLLRVSGVPARMAVGYGPGEVMDPLPPDETITLPADEWQAGPMQFIVRDSHSWSEVFFPGYGWIPFEPTPAYPLVARGWPAPPPPGDIDEGIGPSPGDGERSEKPPADGEIIGVAAPWYVRPLGVSLGLGLIVAIIWLLWRRLLGSVAEPRVAYARMGNLGVLSRLPPQANSTPYEYGRKLAAAVPDVSSDLETVVDTYVRACYGRYKVTGADRSRITEAWPRVRNRLLVRAFQGLLPRRFWLR